MTSEDGMNGNGRRTFSFSLKPDIVKNFNTHCNKYGFALSKRIEILLLKDIEKNGGITEENNSP